MGPFKTRIEAYLNKWIQLVGKDRTQGVDILDLMMNEQLMATCGKELLIFIKERRPRTANEVVECAEKYIEAHGQAEAFSRNPTHTNRPEKDNYGKPDTSKGATGHKDRWVICLRCSKPGHIARDCRSRLKAQLSTIKTITVCSYCKRRGHNADSYWNKKKDSVSAQNERAKNTANTTHSCNGHENVELKCGCALPVVSAACTKGQHETPSMPVAIGYLDGMRVSVLHDSGCSCLVIRKGLLPAGDKSQDKILVYFANGTAVSTTQTEVQLNCHYYQGRVKAVEMDNPLYDVIVGNIPGAACPGIVVDERKEKALAVETRAESRRSKREKPLLTSPPSNIDVMTKDLIEKQANDESLARCRKMAPSGEICYTGKYNKSWYSYEDKVLVRYFQSLKANHGDLVKQVAVPRDLRHMLMKLAHESMMAGHLAAKKKTERILSEFFWPNVWESVRLFCLSCDQCQRCAPKGQTSRVPLEQVPLIDIPFKRVVCDIIGPIIPASGRRNKYILTVVDYCTLYPEAIPMKSIDTETVAEAMVDIFSRIRIPQEILTDRSTQFTSDLMIEVCRLLSVKQLTTTPSHPQCNGLVKRFNGSLKAMLKRLAADREKDWDRYINAALFAVCIQRGTTGIARIFPIRAIADLPFAPI